MNTPTARPEEDPDLARWGLIALGLVIASFLLVFYVHLLQDSVARGAQSRYSQVGGAPTQTQTQTQTQAEEQARLAQIRLVARQH